MALLALIGIVVAIATLKRDRPSQNIVPASLCSRQIEILNRGFRADPVRI